MQVSLGNSGGIRVYGARSPVARIALLGVLAVALVSLLLAGCGSSSEGGNGGGDSGPSEKLSFNPNTTRTGQNITVRGVDLPEVERNTIVRAELIAVGEADEISLGSVNIVNGIFTISVFIPEEMTSGTYTVELRIKGDAQPEEPISAQLTITEA